MYWCFGFFPLTFWNSSWFYKNSTIFLLPIKKYFRQKISYLILRAIHKNLDLHIQSRRADIFICFTQNFVNFTEAGENHICSNINCQIYIFRNSFIHFLYNTFLLSFMERYFLQASGSLWRHELLKPYDPVWIKLFYFHTSERFIKLSNLVWSTIFQLR